RLDALYAWLRRACGAATVAQATAGLEPALRQSGADALQAIYGPNPDAVRGWRGLRGMLPPWRRALRARARPTEEHGLLPLNPRPAQPARARAGIAAGEPPGDLP
ncbi:hypothetical protein, partial [Achromobacter sp.]|uniref:hypothetical protein n=1 Tax=Achromobacter sp. TaxID=134375 RepID=UPI003C763914